MAESVVAGREKIWGRVASSLNMKLGRAYAVG